MSQINITLSFEELVGLLFKGTNEAFGTLMKETLDAFLLAESTEQIGARAYERTGERTDYRSGTRDRGLVTRIGKIKLAVPHHRNVPFQTILFDRYQRSEAALIATMMEMVVQGVSTRKVGKVVEELCGTSFSKSTVSEICKKLDGPVREFKTRKLEDIYPFVMLDAKYFKVRENHRIISKAFMVALGITAEGRKEFIGFGVYDNESKETWGSFLSDLKERGLTEVTLASTDAHLGLLAALKEIYPDTVWQRCQAHFRRNILEKMPKKYHKGFNTELTEMFTAKTIEEARKLRDALIVDYEVCAPKAMEVLDEGFEASMSVMLFPENMRVPLRTTNILERENNELGRRSDVIRIFPNAASLVRLMGAVLIDRHNTLSVGKALWGKKKCLEALHEMKPELIILAREQMNLLKVA